jgi:superfamily II DNA or RNA helicase
MKIEVTNSLLRLIPETDVEDDLIQEFSEEMSFFVQGAHMDPDFKKKIWDGREWLVQQVAGNWLAPVGLLTEAILFFNNPTLDDHRTEVGEKLNLVLDKTIIPNLRDYQRKAVSRVLKERGIRTGKGLLRLPIRSGKTVIAAALICELGHRAVFVVNSDMLLRQTISFFEKVIRFEGKLDEPLIGQWGGGKKEIGWITVASVQGMTRAIQDERIKKLLSDVDVAFFDECFVDGTPVQTPNGKVPIENIRVGDRVLAYDEETNLMEVSKVVTLFENESANLFEVFIGKERFECTGNHPFKTRNGWTTAEQLSPETEVLYLRPDHGMHLVPREDNRTAHQIEERWFEEHRSNLLHPRMRTGLCFENLFGNDGENEQKVCFEKNERKQPDAEKINAGKDDENAEANWSQTVEAGRERHGVNRATENVVRSAGERLGDGVFCRDREGVTSEGASDTLQNRRRKPGTSDRDRDRRWKSWDIEPTSGGYKEIELPNRERVDDSTLFEWRRVRRVNPLSGRRRTYNFEVEKFHTYVIGNGAIVHNCHHLQADSWRIALEKCDARYKVGLSATIYLSKNGMAKGTIWLVGSTGPILFTLTPSDLIQKGWLNTPVIRFTTAPAPNKEISEKSSYGVQYRDAIVKNNNRNQLIARIAKRCKKKGYRPLITVSRIEHADLIAKELEALGLTVAIVIGKTPAKTREQYCLDVKERRTDVLMGTVFGEAVDLPFLEAVIIADGGKSNVLTMQRLRNLTPTDGNDRTRHTPLPVEHYVPVYEFADVCTTMMARHSHERLKMYRTHEKFVVKWDRKDV